MAVKPFVKRQRTLVNVAPFTAFDEMRPNGYFMLPGRKEGERYATLIVYDTIAKRPLGEDQYVDVTIPVDQLAESLIKDHGVDKFGGFVAEGVEPTKEELDAADVIYDQWRRAQIVEADQLWEQYHKHIFISNHAKLACKELGLKRTWLEDVARTKQCPNCGTPNLPTQARCACGAILDYELAREFGLLSEREEQRAIRTGKLTPEGTMDEIIDRSISKKEDEVGTF